MFQILRVTYHFGLGGLSEGIRQRLERLLSVRDGALDLLQLRLRGVDFCVLGEHMPVVRRLGAAAYGPVRHAHPSLFTEDALKCAQ